MRTNDFHIIFCANKKENTSSFFNYLINEGYSVTFTKNEATLLSSIQQHSYLVVVIELDFKPKDAISLTKALKKEHLDKIAIIIFSDKADDYIQISAFDNGADDYIVLPLSPILLSKRINTIASRVIKTKSIQANASQKVFDIDKETYSVFLRNKTYTLPRKEFEMLYLLNRYAHKIVTRAEFSETIWNEKLDDKSRVIDIHIRNIRKILGNDVIQTFKGIGYLLNPELLK